MTYLAGCRDIMTVVSRTSELKDKKSPTGEPIILKRWQDYLWS